MKLSKRRIVSSLRLHGLQASDAAVALLAAAAEREADHTLLERLLASIDIQSRAWRRAASARLRRPPRRRTARRAFARANRQPKKEKMTRKKKKEKKI